MMFCFSQLKKQMKIIRLMIYLCLVLLKKIQKQKHLICKRLVPYLVSV